MGLTDTRGGTQSSPGACRWGVRALLRKVKSEHITAGRLTGRSGGTHGPRRSYGGEQSGSGGYILVEGETEHARVTGDSPHFVV